MHQKRNEKILALVYIVGVVAFLVYIVAQVFINPIRTEPPLNNKQIETIEIPPTNIQFIKEGKGEIKLTEIAITGTLEGSYNITNDNIINSTNTLIFKAYDEPHILLTWPDSTDEIKFFWSNQCVITVHCSDGRIELAEHITTNEAGRVFWNIVSDAYPHSFSTNRISSKKE